VSLSKKQVLITGAAGGIGRLLVSAFVEADASVIATDIDDDGLTEISKKHHGTKLKTRRLDISDYNAVNDTIIDTRGIDILINNAACSMGLIRDDHLNRLVSIDEVSPQMWNRFVSTNLSGAWYLTKAVIPHMRQVGWGRIINITTSFFTMLRPMFHPYGPTKAALEAMSAGHAGEFKSQGITVNVVVPGGPADTPMVPAVTNVDRKDLIPPKSMIPPILWLCSDAASKVTGKRFVAANWDDTASTMDARANSESLIAWPELANNPVWPGGKPTT
jgi:NAD(P)-dependent dehydrogenase (short-subunit alcohol dehydrogenase family)